MTEGFAEIKIEDAEKILESDYRGAKLRDKQIEALGDYRPSGTWGLAYIGRSMFYSPKTQQSVLEVYLPEEVDKDRLKLELETVLPYVKEFDVEDDGVLRKHLDISDPDLGEYGVYYLYYVVETKKWEIMHYYYHCPDMQKDNMTIDEVVDEMIKRFRHTDE